MVAVSFQFVIDRLQNSLCYVFVVRQVI